MSIHRNNGFPVNPTYTGESVTKEHLGRHLEKDCDLNKPFITLVVDSTPRSLSLMTVTMGKYEATVLNHLESYHWGKDGVDTSGVVSTRSPQSGSDAYTIKQTKAGRPNA